MMLTEYCIYDSILYRLTPGKLTLKSFSKIGLSGCCVLTVFSVLLERVNNIPRGFFILKKYLIYLKMNIMKFLIWGDYEKIY